MRKEMLNENLAGTFSALQESWRNHPDVGIKKNVIKFSKSMDGPRHLLEIMSVLNVMASGIVPHATPISKYGSY